MYPKANLADKTLIEKPGTCFVVMPFDDEFELVFATIVEALEAKSKA